MESLEAELAAARALDTADLADAIESIGFECTRCGACCKGHGGEHTATVFPDEVRAIQKGGDDADPEEVGYDWRDVARPMPFGLSDGEDGPAGETFEWALRTDDCGDCTFYEEGEAPGSGACTVYGDRPLICQTYPFSVAALDGDETVDAGDAGTEGRDAGEANAGDGLGTTEPMGGVVKKEGRVRAHECEGLGRDVSRANAEELAAALKERAVRELEEAIAVRDNYDPADADGVVVHDSEGPKRPDGSPLG
jgi:Fe-S-cluster containining protein